MRHPAEIFIEKVKQMLEERQHEPLENPDDERLVFNVQNVLNHAIYAVLTDPLVHFLIPLELQIEGVKRSCGDWIKTMDTWKDIRDSIEEEMKKPQGNGRGI